MSAEFLRWADMLWVEGNPARRGGISRPERRRPRASTYPIRAPLTGADGSWPALRTWRSSSTVRLRRMRLGDRHQGDGIRPPRAAHGRLDPLPHLRDPRRQHVSFHAKGLYEDARIGASDRRRPPAGCFHASASEGAASQLSFAEFVELRKTNPRKAHELPSE